MVRGEEGEGERGSGGERRGRDGERGGGGGGERATGCMQGRTVVITEGGKECGRKGVLDT